MTRKIKINNVDDLIRQYNGGVSTKQIAENLGVSVNTITRAFKERGVDSFRKTKNPINPDTVCEMFNSGKSVNHISKEFQVSRGAINTILRANNIQIRNVKDASVLFTSTLTQEEINRKVANAHIACRGRKATETELIKKAFTIETKGGFDSVYEEILSKNLSDIGINTTPQKAIGMYNIDLATNTKIAVEIFGGNWHSTGSAAARFCKRCKYLFDQGWNLIVIWCDKSFESVSVLCAEYISTIHNAISTDPTIVGQYWMLGCDGQLQATGSLNNDHIPLIVSARSSFRNNT